MPTTLPLTFRQIDVAPERSEIANSLDLAVVAAFTAVGIFVTFALTVLFPLAGNAVAQALM